MDPVSARVLGSLALVGGVVFVAISIFRACRPEIDWLFLVLTSLMGLLLVVSGFRLWRSALRARDRDR